MRLARASCHDRTENCSFESRERKATTEDAKFETERYGGEEIRRRADVSLQQRETQRRLGDNDDVNTKIALEPQTDVDIFPVVKK
jgi:hypothetical protein